MPDIKPHPVIRFADEATKGSFWALARAFNPLTGESDPGAWQMGGVTYPTLIAAGGKVKVALSSVQLYMHNGNVWRSDPCAYDPDQLTIAGIIVEESHRGKGLASMAVKYLQSVADKIGMTLYLEPREFGKRKRGVNQLTTLQLRKWYKRMGFEATKDGGEKIMVYRPKVKS